MRRFLSAIVLVLSVTALIGANEGSTTHFAGTTSPQIGDHQSIVTSSSDAKGKKADPAKKHHKKHKKHHGKKAGKKK